MPIKTIIVIPNRLFHHIIEGYFQINDIKNHVDNFWKTDNIYEETVDTIWDFSDARYPQLSFEIIDRLAEKIDTPSITFKPGRSAILVKDIPEKHLASYMAGLLGNIPDRETAMFQDLQAAKDFVNYPD